MILIDTGYLVALANPNDALHERVLAWSDLLSESLLVTEYVLVEFVDGFSRPDWRNRAYQVIDRLKHPNCTIVGAENELFRAGLALHRERSDKAWSLTVCISFHVMRHHDIHQALAYDHHFEQAGFEPLLRREP